jgi:glycosyltransferase involved in cell wall biosynthesis
VGRISPEKGLDVLLAALASPALRGAHVCVIGDGASRAALERQQTHSGPDQGCTISWHGHLPEASRYLTAFDVLVVSSRTEGSPMVLLEAMAAHVPVVATRVGGIPDILGDRDGLLVPSEDPPALAAAIAAVLTHPEAAAHRATEANVRLQLEFGVPRWTDRYRFIYMVARDAAGLRP